MNIDSRFAAAHYGNDLKHDNTPAPDAIVETNVALLRQRSRVGLVKYGVTLAAGGYTRRELLQHALEEALDLANYLQAELLREDAAGGK